MYGLVVVVVQIIMKDSMKVYICSRYRADSQNQFDRQLQLTKDVAREVALCGHIVLAPHLYYPLFLSDDSESERKLGMTHAVSLLGGCDAIVVVLSMGISAGMENELVQAKKLGIKMIRISTVEDVRELL